RFSRDWSSAVCSADLLVARALCAVPGAVFGHEGAAPVAFGELLPGVKRELQRGDMRSQKHVGNNGVLDQRGMLLFHARVYVVADVAVGPAVESAVFQRTEIIRGQIVAQLVA